MSERLTMANDKYATELGFDYGASSNSDVQARFLEGFAQGMKYGERGFEMQLHYIAHDLSPRARQFYAELAGQVDE